jgi:hypothetical protein
MEKKSKNFYLKYLGHIAIMTGKKREALTLDNIDTIDDLLLNLDETYEGFKEVFDPPNGVFNSRTQIILRRLGQPTFPVIDKEEKVQDRDILTFW